MSSNYNKTFLKDGKYAYDVCPVCGYDKVRAKSGFCWICDNCGLMPARAFFSDPYGKYLNVCGHEYSQNKREELKEKWADLKEKHPTKKFVVVNNNKIEEVLQ